MTPRNLLVMDPSKLGMFNRAAAVRAGAAVGALGGFGASGDYFREPRESSYSTPAANEDEPGTPKWAKGEDYATTPAPPAPATAYPDAFENYPGAAGSKQREDWMAGINRFFTPDTGSPDFNPRFRPTDFRASMGPFILLGGAVLVGGIVLYTLFRR